MMPFSRPLIGLLLALILVACSGDPRTNNDFIEDLLSKMTLEEKIGQMNQYSGFYDPTGPAPTEGKNKLKYDHIKNGLVGAMLNVRGAQKVRQLQQLAVDDSRLGIPLIFGYDVIHGHETVMPIPLGEAASWDLAAIEKSARIGAVEASAQGINWTFAPMVDISRDARWGRIMEGSGEDPYLASKIAATRVKGFQGDDLRSENTLAACAKHFAAYGFVEAGREYNTVSIGPDLLWNVVFPPFQAAINAGVRTVMNSFNQINGIPATADKWLIRDILKKKWDFEGFVVSDWGTIEELISHGFVADSEAATRSAAIAGCDMDMESHAYVNHLENLVQTGQVDEKLVDEAVRRILKVKEELGLFEDPYKYCNEERERKLLGHQEHHTAALEIAKKSIVLLKNNNNLLPLEKSGKRIAVIGHLASSKNSPLGGWRLAAQDHSAISLLEGLEAYSTNEYTYEQGVKLFEGKEAFVTELKINNTDRSGMNDAVKLAAKSDAVIMVLGEHGFQSGEGRSRTRLGLPGLQQELLEKVFAANPNLILVLMNGRPLAIGWADDHVPAILETWQLGSQSGNAIAEVLFGDYNPSGKLPISFPRNEGQVPIYYNYKNTGRPAAKNKDEVFWSHYIDESNTPLYPFGYGLSYTTFEYRDLRIVQNDDSTFNVSISVSNTGDMDGEEVVQLYLHDKVASLTRPVRELKGFNKVFIKSGEEIRIDFNLTESELGFYNTKGEFLVEPGEFDVFIGDQRDLFSYPRIITDNFSK